MTKDLNQATLQPKIVNDNGKVYAELSNGYNTIRIPAQTLHSLSSKAMKLERELQNDQPYYGLNR